MGNKQANKQICNYNLYYIMYYNRWGSQNCQGSPVVPRCKGQAFWDGGEHFTMRRRQGVFQGVGWHYSKRALFSQMKQSLEFRSLEGEGNEISLEKGRALQPLLSMWILFEVYREAMVGFAEEMLQCLNCAFKNCSHARWRTDCKG